MEIRRSYDRLISTMGFPILVRWHCYIESGPRISANTVLVKPAVYRCDQIEMATDRGVFYEFNELSTVFPTVVRFLCSIQYRSCFPLP